MGREEADDAWLRVWQAAESCAADHRDLIVDRPSVRWLGLSCVVLASYRELAPRIGEDAARKLIGRALTRPARERMDEFMRERYGLTTETAGEAWTRYVEGFRQRAEASGGRGFTLVQDVEDGERSFVGVTRCLFSDFFRRNGVPELTPLFCAFDAIWANELNRPEYGVRFERPSTIAEGADACRFHFTRRSSQ